MRGEDPATEVRLREAAGGDEGALGWLLERHRGRLRRMIAVRLDDVLGARLDPSDVVQEALAEAAHKMDAYLRDRPLPFYPWLHRLASERLARARRYHLGALRREAGRERPGCAGSSGGSAAGLAEALADSGTSPSRRLIREEERQRIARALDELPGPDREVLVMRYLDQLAFGEIAAVLGIGEGAARVRHFRALQRLGPILDASGEGPGS